MQLARLRRRMLIALGIPACWTGPSAQPTEATSAPVHARPHRFEASRCPRDTIPETACGSVDDGARSCGRSASRLSNVDDAKLYVTALDDGDVERALRGFRYDRRSTRAYRGELDRGRDEPLACCYSACSRLTVGPGDLVKPLVGYSIVHTCIPAPPGGTSMPAIADRACPMGVELGGALRPYVATERNKCCYAQQVRRIQIQAIPGRALRVDGRPEVAAVARDVGGAWSIDLSPDLAIDDGIKARLAAAWLEIARLEHASIAAFSHLALQLVAAGAPAELIAAAHRAGLDEIEHARIAFALASAYAGERLGPGRFDIARRVAIGSTRELALETFVDGCIGETAAAHQAEVAADSARDPAVAAVLSRVADDETRHAELAWAVVAWCLEADAVTIDELRALCEPSADAPPRDEDLAAYGVLGDAGTAAARAAVLEQVVVPCLAALA